MTLKDIAELAHCSTATVSRVINNEKGVSEATRKYIQQIIDEYDFQPNKAAKGLAEQKTNTLLFVYENTPDNPFYTELIRGAIDGAKEAHQILLFNIICYRLFFERPSHRAARRCHCRVYRPGGHPEFCEDGGQRKTAPGADQRSHR